MYKRQGTTLGHAEGITVAAGTGNVTIRGRAIGNSQGRGILIPLSSTEANKSSVTGQNVTMVGQATEATNNWYGIELGRSSAQATSSVRTRIESTNLLSLTGTSGQFDGIAGNGNFELVGAQIQVSGTGARQPIRFCNLDELAGCTASSIAAGTGGFSYTATQTGSGTGAHSLCLLYTSDAADE